MPEPVKVTNAMRAENEGDRTPEFKQARADLVASVNGWLKATADKRDAGKPLGDEPILTTRRIQRTDMGSSGPSMRMKVDEFAPGVSLTGDRSAEPLVLQAVIENPRRGRVEVVEVQGVDPISAAVNGDTFGSGRSAEIVAGFKQREMLRGGGDSYYEILVRGDGRVERRHLSPHGTHTGQPLKTPADLRMAKQAFELMSRSLAVGARGL